MRGKQHSQKASRSTAAGEGVPGDDVEVDVDAVWR